MSLIKNLIKEPENKPKKSKRGEAEEDGKEETPAKPRPIVRSATDLQRLKLEKLMKNPDKPIAIPEARREKDHMQSVPTFVRNVMGSSAGAGSGEFHVYRHLRRKEYARQKAIQAKSARELMDDNYQLKLEENKRAAEEKTAKKRAKRLKKKQRQRNNKRSRPANQQLENTCQSEASDSEEEEDEDKQAEIDKDSMQKEEKENEQTVEAAKKKSDAEDGQKTTATEEKDPAEENDEHETTKPSSPSPPELQQQQQQQTEEPANES